MNATEHTETSTINYTYKEDHGGTTGAFGNSLSKYRLLARKADEVNWSRKAADCLKWKQTSQVFVDSLGTKTVSNSQYLCTATSMRHPL